MRIPQIQMQSTTAKINIRTTPSQQTIRQPKAQQNLQQPKAQMSIRTTPGHLSIDQSRAWDAMDIKSVFKRTREAAQKGHSDALSGVARRASEGSQLMRIEYGGNAIVSQAKQKGHLLDFQYNIGFVPPPFSVKINYQPGKVHINVNPQKVINHTVAQKPVIDYRAGDVSVSMKQHASLHFDVVDVEV